MRSARVIWLGVIQFLVCNWVTKIPRRGDARHHSVRLAAADWNNRRSWGKRDASGTHGALGPHLVGRAVQIGCGLDVAMPVSHDLSAVIVYCDVPVGVTITHESVVRFFIGSDIESPPLAKAPTLPHGDSVAFTVYGIEPGTYTYWCTVPTLDGSRTHAQVGMTGTLTVTE